MILDETGVRRPGFLAGMSVPLADGNRWCLPAPPLPAELGANSPAFRDLIVWYRDGEEVERDQCVLAFAVYLLRQNYDLRPDQLRALLLFATPEAYAEAKALFHELAIEHVRSFFHPQRVPPPNQAVAVHLTVPSATSHLSRR